MPKRKKGRTSTDEETPLLSDVHVGGDSFDYLADSSYSDGLGMDRLSDEVASIKRGGRKAASKGSGLSSTRTSEALSHGAGAVANVGLIGLDMAMPGAGTAIGGGMAAKAVRDEVKAGKSAVKHGGGQGARVAVGFTPVVGQFVGVAEESGHVLKAIFESSTSRTKGKLDEVDKIRTRGKKELARIAEVRPQVEEMEDGDERETLLRRLNKAESRWRRSLQQADAWLKKKEEHHTLPLLASDGGLDQDDD